MARQLKPETIERRKRESQQIAEACDKAFKEVTANVDLRDKAEHCLALAKAHLGAVNREQPMLSLNRLMILHNAAEHLAKMAADAALALSDRHGILKQEVR